MPQQSKPLHISLNLDSNPPCLPPGPTYSFQDDAEHEYIHPDSTKGHHLPAQAHGYKLPTPSAFSLQTRPSLPPISSLFRSPARLVPLSSNIINTMSVQSPGPHEGTFKSSTTSSEQNPSVKGSSTRKKYTSHDLVAIARAVVEEMPFLAAHGEKANTWAKVNKNLRENGFRHAMSTDLLRHKAEALVHYKKVSRQGLAVATLADTSHLRIQ